MNITNIETVPGKNITTCLGLVSGSTIRTKSVFSDFGTSIKSVMGGELKDYTSLLEDARKEATYRMAESARQKGANAIVNVRYATSSIASGAAEIYVYGTAVIVE